MGWLARRGPGAAFAVAAGLLSASSQGSTHGCVEWSDTSTPTQFVDESGGAPATVCVDSAVDCAAAFGYDGAERLRIAYASGCCLVAVKGCDVWWRRVNADVIPPIPELAVTLPGTGYGTCRSGSGARHGTLGFSGVDFGRCSLWSEDGAQVLDGGGFEILQARAQFLETDLAPDCGDRAVLLKRFDELVTRLLTEDDRNTINRIAAAARNHTPAETGQMSQCPPVDDAPTLDDAPTDVVNLAHRHLSACDLADVLSPLRFVPHALNADGLHALRAVLASRARDARIQAYAPRALARWTDVWRTDGVVKVDYDAVGGDAGLYEILQAVGARPLGEIPRPPYSWVPRNVSVEAGAFKDAQSDAHIDSFASIVKIWLFETPLTAKHGPFMFVKGSQRNSASRLEWLHAYALPPAVEALREPSFRLKGSLAAAKLAFVSDCDRNAEAVLPLEGARLTLVVADTSAIHFRGNGKVGFVRKSYRIQGDNGGGLPRLDPFTLPD